jgi:hypothetical protein
VFSIIGDLFSVENRVHIAVIPGMSMGIGQLVGQAMAGYVGDKYNWCAAETLHRRLSAPHSHLPCVVGIVTTASLVGRVSGKLTQTSQWVVSRVVLCGMEPRRASCSPRAVLCNSINLKEPQDRGHYHTTQDDHFVPPP